MGRISCPILYFMMVGQVTWMGRNCKSITETFETLVYSTIHCLQMKLLIEDVPNVSSQHGGLRDLGTISVKPHSSLCLSSAWLKILGHLFRERLQMYPRVLRKGTVSMRKFRRSLRCREIGEIEKAPNTGIPSLLRRIILSFPRISASKFSSHFLDGLSWTLVELRGDSLTQFSRVTGRMDFFSLGSFLRFFAPDSRALEESSSPLSHIWSLHRS